MKTITYPLTDFCLSAIFFNLKWTHMHAISYETTIWLMLFFSLEILQKYLTKMYSVYSTSYLVALQGSSNIYLITVFLHLDKHSIHESFKLHIMMLTLCIIAHIRITLYYCQCQFPSYNFHFLFFQNCIDKRKLTDTVRYSLDIIAYANVILVKTFCCHKRTKENASISYILP